MIYAQSKLIEFVIKCTLETNIFDYEASLNCTFNGYSQFFLATGTMDTHPDRKQETLDCSFIYMTKLCKTNTKALPVKHNRGNIQILRGCLVLLSKLKNPKAITETKNQ